MSEPGWRGYFEKLEVEEGRLVAQGFLFLTTQRIEATQIVINGKVVGEAQVIDRPDVAEAYAVVPHAGASGFDFEIDPRAIDGDGLADVRVLGLIAGRPMATVKTWYAPGVGFQIPPEHLLRRELANESPSFFKASAMQSYRDLWEPVRRWREPTSVRSVLDWGCGVGRLLFPFRALSGIPFVHGCDVDPEAIAWCGERIAGVDVTVNPALPPTLYADDQFDLVIANSVFTHLAREVQMAWLGEIARITAPGALFLASVHGKFATSFMVQASELTALWAPDGFYDGFHDPSLDGVVPTGYYRGTCQSREYTERTFGVAFEILEYVERGWLNHQDLVVMRKGNG